MFVVSMHNNNFGQVLAALGFLHIADMLEPGVRSEFVEDGLAVYSDDTLFAGVLDAISNMSLEFDEDWPLSCSKNAKGKIMRTLFPHTVLLGGTPLIRLDWWEEKDRKKWGEGKAYSVLKCFVGGKHANFTYEGEDGGKWTEPVKGSGKPKKKGSPKDAVAPQGTVTRMLRLCQEHVKLGGVTPATVLKTLSDPCGDQDSGFKEQQLMPIGFDARSADFSKETGHIEPERKVYCFVEFLACIGAQILPLNGRLVGRDAVISYRLWQRPLGLLMGNLAMTGHNIIGRDYREYSAKKHAGKNCTQAFFKAERKPAF